MRRDPDEFSTDALRPAPALRAPPPLPGGGAEPTAAVARRCTAGGRRLRQRNAFRAQQRGPMHVDEATVRQTLGCILKVREDHTVLEEHRDAIGPLLSDTAELAPGGYSLATDFGFGSVSVPKG